VKNVPGEIDSLYSEARHTATLAPTGSTLCSRKLLMNIAVSKRAAENLRFVEFVEFLADGGYVPPDGRDWVDHIWKKWNEATHEIKLMTTAEATELIDFLEILLKFIYEFPARFTRSVPPASNP